MTHSNDELEELERLKHVASERRASRAGHASKEKTAKKTPSAENIAEDNQDPLAASKSAAIVDKLSDQVETIFGEIGEVSRERPLLALVSAFALGVLVGHLFSRRQD